MILVLASLLASPALAKPPAKTVIAVPSGSSAPARKKAPTAKKEPAKKEAPGLVREPLWDEWFLVSRDGAGVAYYHETAERRPKDAQLAITQQWVEKEGAKRDELYIGSVSAEGTFLPVAFFAERKGAKPYKIDGRVQDGASFLVTFKPGTPGQPKTTGSAPLKPGTYLSSFLPMALARHFAEGVGAYQFTAVVEDAGDMNVEIKKGIAEVQAAEKKAGGEACRQVLMQVDGGLQDWWIAANGKVCSVEMPGGVRVERATEAAAKKALKEGT